MSIDARIADDQPDSFAFTKENEAEIKRIIAKYPKGRQASAGDATAGSGPATA